MNIEWWERIQREADQDDLRTSDLGFVKLNVSSEGFAIESPIEYRLYAWLKRLAEKYNYKVKAQWKLGPFRYDFGITDKNGELLALIECDGKEFHSKPKEQVRDDAKTAFARQANCMIFRWSGKEIWHDPQHCAEATFFTIWPRGQ